MGNFFNVPHSSIYIGLGCKEKKEGKVDQMAQPSQMSMLIECLSQKEIHRQMGTSLKNRMLPQKENLIDQTSSWRELLQKANNHNGWQ